MECYRILFYKSTPSADFEKLMDDTELNEEGQKLIDFMACQLAIHSIADEWACNANQTVMVVLG